MKSTSRSPEAKAWKHLYDTSRWRYRIVPAHLHIEPLCRICMKSNRITEARVIDHIVPHKGKHELFFNTDNLQSLCFSCHNSIKQSEERTGRERSAIGLDGWPI